MVFDNRPNALEDKKEKQVQDLLNLVEQVSEKNNGKPYMGDLSLELRVKKRSIFLFSFVFQFHISFRVSGSNLSSFSGE